MSNLAPQIIDKLPVLEGEIFKELSVTGTLYSMQTLSGELYLPFVVFTGLLVDSDGDCVVDSDGNRIIFYKVII